MLRLAKCEFRRSVRGLQQRQPEQTALCVRITVEEKFRDILRRMSAIATVQLTCLQSKQFNPRDYKTQIQNLLTDIQYERNGDVMCKYDTDMRKSPQTCLHDEEKNKLAFLHFRHICFNN